MIDPRQPDFADTPARRAHAALVQPAPASARSSAPVVSIVTPALNPGPELDETAASVFAQSLRAFEWIIVDDASTLPDAIARLGALAACDPRIRLVRHSQTRGPGAARNTGFAEAAAPLVMQLDADDQLEPTAIEKLAWLMHTHPSVAFANGFSVAFGDQPHLSIAGFHDHERFRELNRVTPSVMVRREVHAAVGGSDEQIRHGLEDWDFWLRCASAGLWGATITEHLDWYRVRAQGRAERWPDWDGGPREAAFAQRLRERHPRAFQEPWPRCAPRSHQPFEPARTTPPFANPLTHDRPGVLLVVPWLAMGGADKFNLRMCRLLAERGWRVTVCTTLADAHPWLPEFTRRTSDVFCTDRFCHPADRPAFLRYLIDSRAPDVVLLSNSELGYQLLPFLRAACPRPAFVDYCHMEETYWKSGGYPRYAAASQPTLDLNIVSSEHLRRFLVGLGASTDRVEVCTTNEDPAEWARDDAERRRVRAELGVTDPTPVILYAARLCAQKQPRVFAGAIGALARRGTPFLALVAGDGPDHAMLRAELARLGVSDDRCRLLGAVALTRVRELMHAADVFFVPSLWEGIALSNFEAMAMGLAVVGANVGGQRELITADTGVLIQRPACAPPDGANPESERIEIERYADALHELLADPARARAMGAAARQRIIDHFPLRAAGDRLDALLRRASELHRADPRPTMPAAWMAEAATRAVEFCRLDQEASLLWAERATLAHPAHPQSADPDAQALCELAEIERSRAWRAIEAVKATPLYRLVARLRWGPGWEAMLTSPESGPESPTQRLARIRAARSFRALERLRRGL